MLVLQVPMKYYLELWKQQRSWKTTSSLSWVESSRLEEILRSSSNNREVAELFLFTSLHFFTSFLRNKSLACFLQTLDHLQGDATELCGNKRVFVCLNSACRRKSLRKYYTHRGKNRFHTALGKNFWTSWFLVFCPSLSQQFHVGLMPVIPAHKWPPGSLI